MKLQISLALLLGASTLFANESLITKEKMQVWKLFLQINKF